MLPIDHIGIAVNSLNDAILKYQSDFGFVLKSREILHAHQVEVAFLKTTNTMLELIMPVENNTSLVKFLNQRGPGLHHICYEVKDIISELKRFNDLGYRLIDSIPRSGAHNTKIAFLHPLTTGGILIELCQYT